MSASNVNVVVITGNLTKDPELRSTGGGTSVCEMRVAVNGRRKDQSGEWVDDVNYFNVVCFGSQAENCAEYLRRGRPVAVQGRLDWREWEAKDDGGRRQAVQIIANSVQFLNAREKTDTETSPSEDDGDPGTSDGDGWTPEPVGVGAGRQEADIPF
jgi:single-strand DNA-binding protein